MLVTRQEHFPPKNKTNHVYPSVITPMSCCRFARCASLPGQVPSANRAIFVPDFSFMRERAVAAAAAAAAEDTYALEEKGLLVYAGCHTWERVHYLQHSGSRIHNFLVNMSLAFLQWRGFSGIAFLVMPLFVLAFLVSVSCRPLSWCSLLSSPSRLLVLQRCGSPVSYFPINISLAFLRLAFLAGVVHGGFVHTVQCS